MDSLSEYFWGLFGYTKVSVHTPEETESETEIECDQVSETTIMLPKQHLLKRRSSKRFVIGDENDDDTITSVIPNIEVTAAADVTETTEWTKSTNHLQPQQPTLT